MFVFCSTLFLFRFCFINFSKFKKKRKCFSNDFTINVISHSQPNFEPDRRKCIFILRARPFGKTFHRILLKSCYYAVIGVYAWLELSISGTPNSDPQIQLYDLCTSGHLTTLRGHAQPVTSLDLHSCPANTLVSGSADRRSVSSHFFVY